MPYKVYTRQFANGNLNFSKWPRTFIRTCRQQQTARAFLRRDENKQGDSFEPDSLENKMTALDRQMKEKGYTCSVVRDSQQFSSSKQVLDGKAKELSRIAGQRKRPNKARQVIFFCI